MQIVFKQPVCYWINSAQKMLLTFYIIETTECKILNRLLIKSEGNENLGTPMTKKKKKKRKKERAIKCTNVINIQIFRFSNEKMIKPWITHSNTRKVIKKPEIGQRGHIVGRLTGILH